MHITISNRKIYINLWDKVENPKGLIQVIHGMAEYGERYEELAKHLNEKGYIVIASDHFGHKNSIDSHYGELGEDGFHTYIEDEIYISKFFKEKYEIPIHIIGHSMGSFITQYIIRKDLDYITSYTITGSNYLKNSKFFLGRYVLKLLSNFRKLKEDKLIDKILFGNFNDRFEKELLLIGFQKTKEMLIHILKILIVDLYILQNFMYLLPKLFGIYMKRKSSYT